MRRREFTRKRNVYAGLTYNASLNSMGAVLNESGCCITDFLPAVFGDPIQFRHGFSKGTFDTKCLIEYGFNKNRVEYWNNGGGYVREISVYNNRTQWIRVTFNMQGLDDCYILNKRTGVYLFKGKNVK